MKYKQLLKFDGNTTGDNCIFINNFFSKQHTFINILVLMSLLTKSYPKN